MNLSARRTFLRLALWIICAWQAKNTLAATLSLKDAVGEAMGESPVIQKSNSLVNEAEWKKVEAYSGFLPTLRASSVYITNHRYMLTNLPFGGQTVIEPNILPTTLANLTVEMPIFDGFANVQQMRASVNAEKAAKSEDDWARFQLQRQVTLQFFRALGAKALKGVADQNLETITDHMKLINLFKKAGMSTSFDILRVEVQMSEAQSEVMNADDNLATSKNHLTQLMGLEHDDRELQGELPELKANMIAGKAIVINDGRNDLRALEEHLQASALEASAAKRFWVPRISLFGEYDYYNNLNYRFYDHSAFRDAYQAGIALRWNLFDGMYSIAQSHESIEKNVQREKDLRLAQLHSTEDLEFWKRKFNYYCSVYQTRVNEVAKSTESVRLAKEGHKAGTRTNSDLLDAEAELFRARADVVNAQLGSIESLVNLELASGTSLYSFE